MGTNRRRTTQWELVFQYLSVPLGMISGVVLVPMYLAHINPEIYGAWLATGNVLAWLSLSDPGLSAVLRQRVAVAYGRKDSAYIGEIVPVGFLLTALVSGLLVGGGLAFAPLVPGFLKMSASVDSALIVRAFAVTVVGLGFMMIYHSIDSIGKGLQSALEMGAILTAVRLLYILFVVVLLTRGHGVMALAWGQFFFGLTNMLLALIFLVFRMRRVGIVMRWSATRVPGLLRMLSYTALTKSVSIIAANADLVLATRLLGSQPVTILALTRRVPESIRPLVDRPAFAFLPALGHLHGAGEHVKARLILVRLMHFLLWALGLFTVGFLALNENFISLWIGKQFYAGGQVNAGICIGILLSVITSSLSLLCFTVGKIKETSVAGAIQGALTIIFLLIGGQCWGMVGLVFAPIVSSICVGIWYYPMLFAKSFDLSGFEKKELALECAKVVLCSCCVYLLYWWFDAKSWLMFTVGALALVVTYLAILTLISKSMASEWKAILVSPARFE